jgi:hypothetical protein
MSRQGFPGLIRQGGSARPLLAALAGAVLGLAVYSVTQLTGRNLYITLGAIAGGLVALVLGTYGRSARLTQLRITVPQFTELTFVVNDEGRQVAWRLYVETVTRMSTQKLGDEDGLLREALNSLHGLFGTTREVLRSSRPSVPAPGTQTVEYLAITLLNNELRPFLARWHPRLREYEQAHRGEPESQWPQAPACRAQLQTLQARTADYALNFARLAGVRDAASMLPPGD